MLIDTHCHIHEIDFPLNTDEVINRAHQAGVMQMICVGTNLESSRQALEFAKSQDGVFASVGIHPHYATGELSKLADLEKLIITNDKLVAIGEIGLDYHYTNSSPSEQIKLLEAQIELAIKHDIPIIFHVRDAFDDFWPVLDKFPQLHGVLHCFTDSIESAEEGLKRGFYIGINGISTFTKDEVQKLMFKSIPIDRILLETDAPFLTPTPLRGKVKVNEPAYIKEIAEYNCQVRHISFDELANITTANARTLFKL